jgi:uncharacterized protein (TIGR03067 family)
MHATLFGTMISFAALAPLPQPKGEMHSLKDLEGVWEIERYEIGTPNGIYEPEALYPRFVIRDGKWWKERDLLGDVVRSLEYTATIDSTKSPPWIDEKKTDSDKTYRAAGIYRLAGDRLTILFTFRVSERPPSVDVQLRDAWQRYTLRRRK